MDIIGIDPSLTGTAIYTGNQYYLLGTEKDKHFDASVDYTMRLISLQRDIMSIVMHHNPDIVGLEGISFGSVGRLAELGALSYFIRAGLIEHKIPFMIIPPTVIKKYWTGKGNASKTLMIETAEKKGCNIPYFKKIKGQEYMDDNCVDATAIRSYVEDYLDQEWEQKGVELYDPHVSFS